MTACPQLPGIKIRLIMGVPCKKFLVNCGTASTEATFKSVTIRDPHYKALHPSDFDSTSPTQYDS